MLRDAPTDQVEIIVGGEACSEAFISFLRTARHEVRGLESAHWLHLLGGTPLNEIEVEQIEQGMRYRAIYDRAGLEHARTDRQRDGGGGR